MPPIIVYNINELKTILRDQKYELYTKKLAERRAASQQQRN